MNYGVIYTDDDVKNYVVNSVGKDSEIFCYDAKNLINLINLPSELMYINVVGGLSGSYSTSLVPSLLDTQNLVHLGNDPLTSAICQDKFSCKSLLKASHIPTPRGILFRHSEEVKSQVEYPVIIKPNFRDNSSGIDNSSVVSSWTSLLNRVAELLEKLNLGPNEELLVEEFIRGREYSAVVLGFEHFNNVTVLPVLEYEIMNSGNYVYGAELRSYLVDNPSKIYSYIKKANQSSKLTSIIAELAVKVYKVLGIKGWCQIDFIVYAGVPNIIDVNTTPKLCNTSNDIGTATVAADYNKLNIIDFLIKPFKES